MARLVGVDLPRDKRVEIGLTYIYGIGLTTSKQILAETGVDPTSVSRTSRKTICRSFAIIFRKTSRWRATYTVRFPRTSSASWRSVAIVACAIVAACPFADSARTRMRARARVLVSKSAERKSEVVSSGS